MAIAEVEPNEYGDFPANIEFMPGERRINHSGSNLAGVKKTLDEMIDNDHALIPTLIDDEDEKYVVDGAEACSLGPEGQVVRWWKRPKEWIKKHKKEIIKAAEVKAIVAGTTVTVTAVTLDVLHHIRERKINNTNGKNTNNSH